MTLGGGGGGEGEGEGHLRVSEGGEDSVKGKTIEGTTGGTTSGTTGEGKCEILSGKGKRAG